MAKYTISYACGCGTYTEQLYGKTSERERRIKWLEANKLCKECYLLEVAKKDAATQKKASIHILCNSIAVTLQVEVIGQTIANKEALAAIGISRQPKRGAGFMDIFAMGEKWFCGTQITVNSIDHLKQQYEKIKASLATIGYPLEIADQRHSVDLSLALEFFRQKEKAAAEKAQVFANDPPPPTSPLRKRIAAMEKDTGSTWNGKIYGTKGNFNFYVNNTRHTATDEEVTEREENLKLHKEWKNRNPHLVK